MFAASLDFCPDFGRTGPYPECYPPHISRRSQIQQSSGGRRRCDRRKKPNFGIVESGACHRGSEMIDGELVKNFQAEIWEDLQPHYSQL